MLQENKAIQRFNSGILEICIREQKRVKKNLLDSPIRYQDETLGVTRFYEARVADSSISRVISVPFIQAIKNEDREKYVVKIGDTWYEVDMIQNKFDSFEPKLLLTLKRGGIFYVDERSTDR